MSARRLLVVAALVLFFYVPAEAQKRRSVRSNPGTPPASGTCHTFGLVQAGTKANYLTTAPGGDVTFTITWVSDTPTQTKTTQKVTVTVPVLGPLTTETDVSFAPSLASGPAAGWCVGNT